MRAKGDADILQHPVDAAEAAVVQVDVIAHRIARQVEHVVRAQVEQGHHRMRVDREVEELRGVARDIAVEAKGLAARQGRVDRQAVDALRGGDVEDHRRGCRIFVAVRRRSPAEAARARLLEGIARNIGHHRPGGRVIGGQHRRAGGRPLIIGAAMAQADRMAELVDHREPGIAAFGSERGSDRAETRHRRVDADLGGERGAERGRAHRAHIARCELGLSAAVAAAADHQLRGGRVGDDVEADIGDFGPQVHRGGEGLRLRARPCAAGKGDGQRTAGAGDRRAPFHLHALGRVGRGILVAVPVPEAGGGLGAVAVDAREVGDLLVLGSV